MLKISIVLHKRGSDTDTEEMGSLHVWNDGTGTETTGNYRYTVFGKRGVLMGQGEVRRFKRKRHHAWKLITACLDDFYKNVELDSQVAKR